MKIQFNRQFSDTHHTYEPHTVYDVKNEDAIRYIEGGYAKKVSEPVSEPIEPAAANSPLKPGEHEGHEGGKPPATPVKTPEKPKDLVPAVEPDASTKGDKKSK